MKNIRIPRLSCRRCGHTWTPRTTEVRICPQCKSAYWDRLRSQKPQKEGS